MNCDLSCVVLDFGVIFDEFYIIVICFLLLILV